MTKPIDTFWLDLSLRNDSYSPDEITEGLGIQPFLSGRKGEIAGPITRKATTWNCHLSEGIGNERFVDSLHDLLSFFNVSSPFLERFKLSGGEIEVVINQAVAINDGILFRLFLDSDFLKTCGEKGISLRVQAWSATED